MIILEKVFCPESLDEATMLLAQYGGDVRICAGGTDLLVMMRKGKHTAKYLMDISGLGLNYICGREDGSIAIGATATLSEVSRHPLLAREPYLFLQEAARHIGSAQIRNAATLAGNICTGISSADAAPPLLALDAQVKTASRAGERLIPISGFFLRTRELTLRPGELVTELILPPAPEDGTRTFFRKVGTRKELFISILNAAVRGRVGPGGYVEEMKLAMGVVAPVPLRLRNTEDFLTGKRLSRPIIEDALKIMQEEIYPRTSRHGSETYRRLAAANILQRFLTQLYQESGGGETC